MKYIIVLLCLLGSIQINIYAEDYFNADKATALSIGTTGIGFAYVVEEPLRYFTQNNRTVFLDDAFIVPNQFGEIYFSIPLSVGVYAYGKLNDDKKVENTGIYLIEAHMLNAAITFTMKTLLGRSRPYNNKGHSEFFFWQFNKDNMSFPSGHTSSAFTSATIISHQINSQAGYIISYALASLTMASRIYYDKHWFSDTMAGAVIGTLSGLIILELNKDDNIINKKPETPLKSSKIFNISIPL